MIASTLEGVYTCICPPHRILGGPNNLDDWGADQRICTGFGAKARMCSPTRWRGDAVGKPLVVHVIQPRPETGPAPPQWEHLC